VNQDGQCGHPDCKGTGPGVPALPPLRGMAAPMEQVITARFDGRRGIGLNIPRAKEH